MEKLILFTNDFVWGAPALIAILGVGFYLSIRLRFAQLTLFTDAFGHFLRQFRKRDSSFQALCTALAATVGTGNLVGVAGALCLGGPGSIFWMWICGFFGMITKYTEAVLAIRYRQKNEDGYSGGPMYMITQALPGKWHFLAFLYALFGFLASFGVGNITQIHAAVNGCREMCSVFGLRTGRTFSVLLSVVLAMIVGVFLHGGAKRICSAAERLVPFAAVAYILLCVGILCQNWQQLPNAFLQILEGAFCPKAVTGGMIGSAFQALRIGCRRGVFTNEAGMGTAAIAHGTAEVSHPVQQGMMGMIEVFLDTMLLCTLTALTILVSGVPIPYGTDAGGHLTTGAFCTVYGPGAAVWLAALLTLFAVAAVMGWGLYGARCGEFLFGERIWRLFPAMQILAIVLSSFLKTPVVWQVAELFNGLMAIPNLITLAVLTPEVCRLTKEYKNRKTPVEVPYANFHQCKSL